MKELRIHQLQIDIHNNGNVSIYVVASGHFPEARMDRERELEFYFYPTKQQFEKMDRLTPNDYVIVLNDDGSSQLKRITK